MAALTRTVGFAASSPFWKWPRRPVVIDDNTALQGFGGKLLLSSVASTELCQEFVWLHFEAIYLGVAQRAAQQNAVPIFWSLCDDSRRVHNCWTQWAPKASLVLHHILICQSECRLVRIKEQVASDTHLPLPSRRSITHTHTHRRNGCLITIYPQALPLDVQCWITKLNFTGCSFSGCPSGAEAVGQLHHD